MDVLHTVGDWPVSLQVKQVVYLFYLSMGVCASRLVDIFFVSKYTNVAYKYQKFSVPLFVV